MNFRLIPLLILGFLYFITGVFADVVVLNDGKTLEGKIIFEDDSHYLLEVHVTKSIKDEKKIPKNEVKSVQKEAPDIEAFGKLKALVPTPDLLDASEYELRMKKIEDFIKEFPKSPKLEEVRNMHERLDDELAYVKQGGFKFSGEMVTNDEYLASAYAYDQLIALAKINRDIEYRNFLGALRGFSDYESKFAGAQSREELIPKIKQVLIAYKASLAESIAGYDSRIQARELGLARMGVDDRLRTERAIEDQMAALKSKFDQEKLARETWITPDAYLKDSILEALRQVDSEIKRLDTPPKQVAADSLEEAYREAWKKLPSASAEESKKIFEELKRQRMPEFYFSMLQKRAAIEPLNR
jgi:hypothetical protein